MEKSEQLEALMLIRELAKGVTFTESNNEEAWGVCPYCYKSDTEEHEADCLVSKAREFLGNLY